MARFSGRIGYVTEIETAPGVHDPVVNEFPARGDVLQKHYRWSAQTHSTNSADTLSDQISIGADDFAMRLCRQAKMRYVIYDDDPETKYAITDAKIDRPRIVLTIGGIYNARKPL